MPANLTPQYLAAEQLFKEAVTTKAKIEALEKMMAVMPKHKGTEKLQADLRRRLAKLRSEGTKKHGVSKASAMYSVQREGAGQVVLVGAPNVGKSSLLSYLTKAAPEIGDYPFTTRLPQPGMMRYENIQIQLIDTPPITPENFEPWHAELIKSADAVLLMMDLESPNPMNDLREIREKLKEKNIELVSEEQDISEENAIAEGVAAISEQARSYKAQFAILWNLIHGEGAWDRNDYIWVIEFKRKE